MATYQFNTSSDKNKPAGWGAKIFLCAFFFIFFAMGSLFTVFIIKEAYQNVLSYTWLKHSCVILESSISERNKDDADPYVFKVLYEYEYQGRSYRSDSYSTQDYTDDSYSKLERKKRFYRPGAEVECYLNPKAPQESILQRGSLMLVLVVFFPLIFVAIGIGGIYFTLTGTKAGQQQALSKQAGSHVSKTGMPKDVTGSTSFASGPLTLKVETSPASKVIGAIIFSVFWNGVVSVFLWQAVQGWQKGSPDWFLTIFLIPFVVIGLGAIGAIGYFLLALRNPRPLLELDKAPLRLGDEVLLRWSFSGNINKLKSVKIVLEGMEEATYQQGTDTHTDTEVFYTHGLLEQHGGLQMSAGECLLKIPASSMHSFQATNNKIIWRIRVKGDIPNWPDVDDSFVIEVLAKDSETQSSNTMR